ncbi:hypothetical protein [Microbacterium sp. NPDC056057]|uniref:hypothetical protein n=1 Tax=Microbacterium sp. NPDC056057 TaxID=3345699 RepID=UPI0035E09D30
MAGLVLLAQIQDGDEVASDSATPTLAAPSGATITWTVTADGGTLRECVLDGGGARTRIPVKDDKGEVTLPVDTAGEYKAVGKDANGADVESLPITLEITEDEGDGGGNGGGPPPPVGKVIETDTGYYDEVFAVIVGLLTVAATAVVVWSAWTAIGRFGIDVAPQTIAEGTEVNGTWGQRALAVLLVFMLAVGAVMLIVGAALAALETRGRLKGRKDGSLKTRAGVDLEGWSKFVEAVRTTRGSVVVAVSGLIIVVSAGGFALGIVGDTSSDPAPQPSSTATPTVEVGDDPADDPADDSGGEQGTGDDAGTGSDPGDDGGTGSTEGP